MCISAWVCVFHVGHLMGTKQAVCAPSVAEMYTVDNRRLQSFSIGAALLIVPRAQWAFLSLSLCLSLFMSIYREWSNHILTDAVLFHPTSPQAQDIWLDTRDVALISSHLYKGQRSLVTQGLNASHCRRGTISPGTPQSMLTLCMWEKKSRCWKGWRVFPSSFCSHDHLRTTRPHDFDMTGNHPLCGGKKKIISCLFFHHNKTKRVKSGWHQECASDPCFCISC